MFHPGADLAVFGVAVLLTPKQSPPRALAVRALLPAVGQAPSPSTVTPGQCTLSSDFRQAWASTVVPGTGRAAAITSRVSAPTMTCTFAENRQFREGVPTPVTDRDERTVHDPQPVGCVGWPGDGFQCKSLLLEAWETDVNSDQFWYLTMQGKL